MFVYFKKKRNKKMSFLKRQVSFVFFPTRRARPAKMTTKLSSFKYNNSSQYLYLYLEQVLILHVQRYA